MRIVMMGTGTFAEPTFQALLASPHEIVGLVTQPDRATGETRGSTRQTGLGMKNIAQERDIPVLQPESVNTPEGLAGLQAFRPELLVVAAYGQILKDEILNVAPRGGINVHASLLPKYRGAAPIAWAIYHGEKQTGVTIIRMTTGLDAGDMLTQAALDILPDETAGELESRLAPLGARLAMDIIARMEKGVVKGLKQDKTLVTKAPKLTKEHGVIDWSRTAEVVCNHLRAMQPWPTAYTFWHRAGQPSIRLIVCKARVERLEEAGKHSPGELVKADAEGVLVAAGEGTFVKVIELQPAGKRRMSAGDFLRGRPLKPGDRLGKEE